MPNQHSAEAHTTALAVLDLEGIADRYRIGKTKATEVVQEPGFLNSVVPGMHRYPVATARPSPGPGPASLGREVRRPICERPSIASMKVSVDQAVPRHQSRRSRL